MRIGITMGDPAGIGPEVLLKALRDPDVQRAADLVVLGDLATLRRTSEALHVDCPYPSAPTSATPGEPPHGIVIWDFANAADVAPGRPSKESGAASLQYIHRAIDLALTGEVDAIVTGPISKQAVTQAGSHLAGHTEILAQRTRTRRPVMMLAGERLRVALVTIHVPVKRVPALLTQEGVTATIRTTHQALKELFGVAAPRIAVCALNPHAGEGGRFGSEEGRIIEPAIGKARAARIDASGPHPADAVFFQAAGGRYDAVVAMYHDQGLIPLKLLHFEDAVNVTLGLPIIRTSVDHGTAYDIVGKGVAGAGSMIAAITTAARFAELRASAKALRRGPD